MDLCCFFCHRRHIKSKRKIVLLLAGLDNAGKTSLGKSLAGDDPDDVIPTVGFSSFNLSHAGMQITLYDLGGGRQIRGIWPKYYGDVHGIIYVIDSGDPNRIEESKEILEEMLSHERLAGKPVLLLANKQDLTGAFDEIDIVEKLNLEILVNEKKCPTLVEICSSKMLDKRSCDPRLLSGYRWLLRQILRQYSNLDSRVQEDMSVDHRKHLEMREAWRKKKEEELNELDTESIENGFKPVSEVIEAKTLKEERQRRNRSKSGGSNRIVPLHDNDHYANGNANGISESPSKNSGRIRKGRFSITKSNRVGPEALFAGPNEPPRSRSPGTFQRTRTGFKAVASSDDDVVSG